MPAFLPLSLPISFLTTTFAPTHANLTSIPAILREKKNHNSFFRERSFLIRAEWRRRRVAHKCGCSNSYLEPKWADEDYKDDEFVVVNFYRFAFVEDPEEEVSKHLSFLQGLNIHGRIYLNEQGINAQYSGPSKDAFAYLKWVREDRRFSDILFQISPASGGHAFPRLRMRYKPSLVQLEGGISHLPLLDSSMRATPLNPSEWRQRLEAASTSDKASTSSDNADFIILDVRNGYEWDIGHFSGAQRPDVDCFRSTSFGLSEEEINSSDPLASVDKEKTDILMYCTGGIRCDVYSTILRTYFCYEFRSVLALLMTRYAQFIITVLILSQTVDAKMRPPVYKHIGNPGIKDIWAAFGKSTIGILFVLPELQRGFKNLYTLEGGVSHYLKSEGPVDWVGNLFVFDSRLSLPPSAYKPELAVEASEGQILPEDSSFAKCYICSSQLSELRHRNCANIDCNLLFLCCRDCVNDLRGCCCLNCTQATRLRPVLSGQRRYDKWHKYRDLNPQKV